MRKQVPVSRPAAGAAAGASSAASATASPRGRGRPRDESKRAAIIGAAQHLFIAQGFAGTSMEAIADRAGVSKLTVYNQFGSKQEMFAASLIAKCDEMLAPLDLDAVSGLPVRDALVAIGHTFLKLILSPAALAMFRLIAEEPSPELTELFHRNAILRTNEQIAAVLASYARKGTLRFDDADQAAWDYLTLVKGRPHVCLQIGLPPMSRRDLARHVEHCADFALRAWGAGNARR
jgi:TetR/AcrR family transcriptional repressor of mexJK operon